MDMKYGHFTTDRDKPQRKDPVDFDNLPCKCCAKCQKWVDTGKECGACTDIWYDNEWDYFSYADDCCDNFEESEE